jgi:type II secretion system protein G
LDAKILLPGADYMFVRRGFTLVELLIVIIIIAVLSAIAIPKFMNSSLRSQEAKARTDLALLRRTLLRVHLDTGVYPLTLTVLDDNARPAKGRKHNGVNWLEPAMPSAWQGPYISQIPACPLNGYQYALRWSSSGVLNVRISTTGDAENDNNEPGNPYFNW